MDPDFLARLVCPRTRKRLRAATAAELGAVNDAIRAGRAVNRAGAAVTTPIDAALIPESEPFAYPIVDGIPVLLADEAIALGAGARAHGPSA